MMFNTEAVLKLAQGLTNIQKLEAAAELEKLATLLRCSVGACGEECPVKKQLGSTLLSPFAWQHLPGAGG
jgi:hypothetical protein